MSRPKPIRGILESTLKGLELDFHLKAYSVWGSWEEIVGESVARQAQPRSIRNRILFIEVSHPTWVQQLQFLKPHLLEKLNGFLGEPVFKDIRFRLGKITPPPSVLREEGRPRKEGLDGRTLGVIEGYLQSIRDEEVRKSVREVLIRAARLGRSPRKQEEQPLGPSIQVDKKNKF